MSSPGRVNGPELAECVVEHVLVIREVLQPVDLLVEGHEGRRASLACDHRPDHDSDLSRLFDHRRGDARGLDRNYQCNRGYTCINSVDGSLLRAPVIEDHKIRGIKIAHKAALGIRNAYRHYHQRRAHFEPRLLLCDQKGR